ncbi:hypothetical protein [Ramlibacter rhizophilus]|uniref:Uncharacterized protein n=1 Tax=Ramlibacter rhizophilus TaxID=1781167 RepID=A0A4Z0C428_9BURK|nr:hypothetical protein [Ramlibacter rhizophilus]TFZ04955.1 hypothetical protein EZ242_04190 [Ramlibacter rhizophilus]
MRWLKPNIKSSLYALLGHSTGPSPEHLHARIEEIRAAMLALMGSAPDAVHPRLADRLRTAHDIEALWYARSELVAARAAAVGEARAQREVARITAMFGGLMPMRPRPHASAHR